MFLACHPFSSTGPQVPMENLCFGAVGPDGVGGYNQWSISQSSDNATSLGIGERFNLTSNSKCLQRMDANGNTRMLLDGNGNGGAGNPGPIADGWRVNHTTGDSADGANRIIKYSFFGGTDLRLWVGTTPALGNQDVETGLIDMKMCPDGIMIFGNGQAFNDARKDFITLSQGMASRLPTTKNTCIISSEDDDEAGNNYQHILTNRCGGAIDPDTGATLYTIELTTWETDGIRLTVRDGNSGGDQFGIIAFQGVQVHADVLDSPTTAASDWVNSDPGFLPVFTTVFPSFITTVDTLDGGTNTYTAGFDMSDGTTHASISISVESSSPSDTQSQAYTDFCRHYSPAGSLTHDVNAISFNNNGWTATAANITQADATTRKWLAFTVGDLDIDEASLQLPYIQNGGVTDQTANLQLPYKLDVNLVGDIKLQLPYVLNGAVSDVAINLQTPYLLESTVTDGILLQLPYTLEYIAEEGSLQLPYAIEYITDEGSLQLPYSLQVPSETTLSIKEKTIKYFFTLTGAGDSTTDIVIPIENFQTRLNINTGTSFVSASIPNGSFWIPFVQARTNGEIVIEREETFADGSPTDKIEVVRADYDRLQPSRGARRDTLQIFGFGIVTNTNPKNVVINEATFTGSLSDGFLRIRTQPNNELRVGDLFTFENSVNRSVELFLFVGPITSTLEIQSG